MTAKKAAPRPTSIAKVTERLDELDQRVQAIEKMIKDSQDAKKREYARQLAADPEKLNALKSLVDLAQESN